jgi:glycerol-3-phosphate dehydrogenase (NAD(P)+)
MHSAIMSAAPLLKPGCPLISFAKGIDAKSEKTMPELFTELAPAHPLATIGGPMLAEEISGGGNAAAVIASKDENFRAALHNLFSSPQFRAEPSADPESVAWAGVLKNIYAFALGIADGLKVSDNEKGWLAAKAIDEMAGLATIVGADPAIILGTAGVGDFIATGYSQHSRNRQAGDEIVATGTCKVPGEGLMSLPAFIKRLGSNVTANFPLLAAVKKITLDHEPAKATIDAYFRGR